jgi:hypothetical protein
MVRVVLYWCLVLLVLILALRRGDRDTRIAAVICLIASAATVLLRQLFSPAETEIAILDVTVLLTFVVIALRSSRFWPLWVAGLQLTTTLAHGFRLLTPGLVDIAYQTALRFWSYPILLIVIVAALRSQTHRPVESASS